jgi:hypothetical protein
MAHSLIILPAASEITQIATCWRDSGRDCIICRRANNHYDIKGKDMCKRPVPFWVRRFWAAPTATVLAVLVLAMGVVTPVRADAVIGAGTPGSCTTEAAANALSSAVAAGGVISFNCGPELVEIVVNTNATDQTVVVNGGGLVRLSGNRERQVFFVFGSGNLTLNDLSLINGDASQGGGIYVDSAAQVTINRSFLTSNVASAGGGGVYNRGTLAINSSTLGSNQTGSAGGAIYNDNGSVTLSDSYLVSNQAQNGGGVFTANGQLTIQRTGIRGSIVGVNGGGLYIAGPTQITNSTFSNNRANSGGGLYSVANTTVLNATFNENRADLGGAIFRSGGAFSVKNTILAGSLDQNGVNPSLNCDGTTLATQGRNLVSDNSCVPNPSSVGDLLSTDPKLGVWLGPVERGYLPNADSPVVDYAQDYPAVDQRGYPRPLGPGCDVGAIERGAVVYLPMVQQ